ENPRLRSFVARAACLTRWVSSSTLRRVQQRCASQEDREMAFEIRRIVSGHNAQGKSIFIMDGNVSTPAGRRSAAGTQVVELWQTDTMPADNTGDKDPTDHPYRLPPPTNGTVFRVVEYPPDSQRFAKMDAADWGKEAAGQGYQRTGGNARHAGFHKTDTIDYAIVIEGEKIGR